MRRGFDTAPWSFRPLVAVDLPMLHGWLCRPHVAQWWPAPRSYAEFVGGFREHVDPACPTRGHIALYRDDPVGFVQSYRVKDSGDGWWLEETDPGARGIDQFLADEGRLGQGFGSAMIAAFVANLLEDPAVTRVQTDPSPDNPRAIRACLRAGFRPLREVATPDGPALLMVQRRA